MALEIKKRGKESSVVLVRRFNRILKQSGILLRAREIRFQRRKKSEEMKKRAAMRREEKKKEYERLRKLGKIE